MLRSLHNHGGPAALEVPGQHQEPFQRCVLLSRVRASRQRRRTSRRWQSSSRKGQLFLPIHGSPVVGGVAVIHQSLVDVRACLRDAHLSGCTLWLVCHLGSFVQRVRRRFVGLGGLDVGPVHLPHVHHGKAVPSLPIQWDVS